MLKIYYYPLIDDYVFLFGDGKFYLQMRENYFKEKTWFAFTYCESMELVAEVED